MNVEVPPLPPKGKGKVSKKAANCGNNRKNLLFGIILKKYRSVRVSLRLFAIIAKKLILPIVRGIVLLIY